MSTATMPDTIEHLDFDPELPCEDEQCYTGHPPAVVVVALDCPCSPADPSLLCGDCLEDYITDGSKCTECGRVFEPGESFRIVRWLR